MSGISHHSFPVTPVALCTRLRPPCARFIALRAAADDAPMKAMMRRRTPACWRSDGLRRSCAIEMGAPSDWAETSLAQLASISCRCLFLTILLSTVLRKTIVTLRYGFVRKRTDYYRVDRPTSDACCCSSFAVVRRNSCNSRMPSPLPALQLASFWQDTLRSIGEKAVCTCRSTIDCRI